MLLVWLALLLELELGWLSGDLYADLTFSVLLSSSYSSMSSSTELHIVAVWSSRAI